MEILKSNLDAFSTAGAVKAITGTFADGNAIAKIVNPGAKMALLFVTLSGTIPSILQAQVVPSRDGVTWLKPLPALNYVAAGVVDQTPAVFSFTTAASTAASTTACFWINLIPGMHYRFDLRGTGTAGDSRALAQVDLFG